MSRKDFETLEKIESITESARYSGKSLSKELARGDKYFASSLKTLTQCGTITEVGVAVFVLIPIVLGLISLSSSYSRSNINIDYILSLLSLVCLPIIIFSVPNLIAAIKLRSLKITPTNLLVMLIIISVVNGMLSASALVAVQYTLETSNSVLTSFITTLMLSIPILAFILDIIALTKYKVFKEWFYNLTRKQTKR